MKAKLQKKTIILISSIIMLFFLYGILVGHYNFFPFEIISDIKNSIIPQSESSIRQQIHQDFSEINNLISFENTNDILTKKEMLIKYIWFDDSLPSTLPVNHTTNISDELSNLKNLDRIDSFTVEMEYGMNSISYLFLANNSNNKLIIYHQGDDSQSSGSFDNHSFLEDRKLIQYFLNENYSVLIFSMVGHGMNNEPIVELDNLGDIRLNSHEYFVLLETEKFQPIKFFLEPVIITLNQIDIDYSFDSYDMIGKNEGGWSTIVISALDDRIKNSYAVASSFPLWMSPNEKNFGGYEHHLPSLYQIANYLELYIMSAYGNERSLTLFYNEFDPCCFSGDLYQKYPFADVVNPKLKSLDSGEFNVFIDNNQTENIVSDSTLEIINKLLLN
jgi:hypothetical protein